MTTQTNDELKTKVIAWVERYRWGTTGGNANNHFDELLRICGEDPAKHQMPASMPAIDTRTRVADQPTG